MGGSQLKQLKAAISSAGLARQSQPSSNSKKRKRSGAVIEHREKRVTKLKEIHEQFNQFDVKVTKLKHDVGGRKLKGVVGKPTASREAGIEQRKKTLLAEYNLKGKSGSLVDRRFGENDPTMSLEERMLERFTRERQRASKGAMFNLEDEEELTHYGQSLSKFDDFDDAGILDDEEEDDKGQIDAATVKKVHFGGFSDEDEGDEDGPPRKRTKAEVMTEVIAKSKEHKYARQQQKEQDDGARHQLDQDFDTIRGLLFTRENMYAEPTTGDSAAALGPDMPKPPPVDDDYDQLVRELVFDKRSRPKDRTKTEDEIAQEEKEALEKAERARLRRMMGEEDEGTGGEGERRKRPRGADDLDDDFMEEAEDEGWAGIGTGLTVAGAPQVSDDDGSEHTDPEQDEEDHESGSEGEDEDDDEARSNSEDESDGVEEREQESLVSTMKPKGTSTTSTSSPKKSNELPFTFPCPSSHEEFIELLEGVDRADIGTVIERIRKLHHPSLGEENTFKLQACLDLTSVLLDHILYISREQPPALKVIDAILPHFVELSKAYPIRSADEFVKKLKVMQKNLNRGLQDPLSPSSKTFPGAPELILLRVLGGVWSTSDMKHAVVGPARYLMGAYLGLPRTRSLADTASGLFLCSLFYEYEQDSKRFVPEVINFLVNTVLLVAPTSFKDEASIPGTIPTPDFGAEYTQSLKIRGKRARDLQPGKPALFAILNGGTDEQAKVDLLTLSVDLLGRFAEMYKPLDAFIEIYTPVLDVLEQVQVHKLSSAFQAKLTGQIDVLSRLLRFSREGRQPLLLQAHKPIPIATYIPKFESHSSSSYLRSKDPDAERAAAQKLRVQYRQEKKGAMRELRKDNRFLAAVAQERKQAQDTAYNERMKKVMGSLEGERAEQRREEKAKAREKKRAGKK